MAFLSVLMLLKYKLLSLLILSCCMHVKVDDQLFNDCVIQSFIWLDTDHNLRCDLT